MKREKLTHIVTFRIDYEQWAQLESAAQNASTKPNDWVRDLTIATLAHDSVSSRMSAFSLSK